MRAGFFARLVAPDLAFNPQEVGAPADQFGIGCRPVGSAQRQENDRFQ